MSEKYLNVILAGHNPVKAFKNKNKSTDPKDSKKPDYKGDGVAVWVNERKEKPKEENQDGL